MLFIAITIGFLKILVSCTSLFCLALIITTQPDSYVLNIKEHLRFFNILTRNSADFDLNISKINNY